MWCLFLITETDISIGIISVIPTCTLLLLLALAATSSPVWQLLEVGWKTTRLHSSPLLRSSLHSSSLLGSPFRSSLLLGSPCWWYSPWYVSPSNPCRSIIFQLSLLASNCSGFMKGDQGLLRVMGQAPYVMPLCSTTGRFTGSSGSQVATYSLTTRCFQTSRSGQ